MDKFWSYLGGVIGGFSLIYVPVSKVVPGLEPLLDTVGVVSVVVFASALIVRGVLSLFNRL